MQKATKKNSKKLSKKCRKKKKKLLTNYTVQCYYKHKNKTARLQGDM